MDRHPQQIKRERQDVKRRARNIDALSRLRTNIKKVLATTTKADADPVYNTAVSVAPSHKVWHHQYLVHYLSTYIIGTCMCSMDRYSTAGYLWRAWVPSTQTRRSRSSQTPTRRCSSPQPRCERPRGPTGSRRHRSHGSS